MLKEILNRTSEVDAVILDIAQASEEQNEGLTQVATAVSQMDKVTRANASGAEEAAASAEELTAQAEIQKQTVAQLLALVQGNRSKVRRYSSANVEEPRLSNALLNS